MEPASVPSVMAKAARKACSVSPFVQSAAAQATAPFAKEEGGRKPAKHDESLTVSLQSLRYPERFYAVSNSYLAFMRIITKHISSTFRVHEIRALTALTLFCLLTGMGFSSCASKRLPPPAEPERRFSPVSEALKVDLFFDATLSMQGFVRTPENSYYQRMIPLLERGVIEGWRGGEASFYEFGDDIAPLPGRDYLDAARPTFYSNSKYNKKTFIERVIDRAQLDHLTIIITDLFQDNADVNQLSEKLKQKFIVNNLAVGVMAVRSQYLGVVYDVGAENYSFGYTSKEKPETGRPFYLLAFGSHANIAHYFATLGNSGLNAFPEKHVLILSSFLTSEPSPFTSTKLKIADKLSEISSSNVFARNYSGEQVKAFKITKGQAKAKFSTDWAYQPLPDGLDHSSELTPIIQGWKGEDTGARELFPSENLQALKALTITAKLLPENAPYDRLQVAGDINVVNFPSAGLYFYRILLRPARYSLPHWVAVWNMGEGEIEKWHLHPADFDGSKTYNLENFLGTLQGAVLNTTPPEVSEIYCYIRVDK